MSSLYEVGSDLFQNKNLFNFTFLHTVDVLKF